MYKFIIKGLNFGEEVGTLTIDNDNKMEMRFYDNIKEPLDIPYYTYQNYEVGKRIYNHDECLKYFSRILAPPDRVNMPQMLKEIGLEEYNIVEILKRITIGRPKNFTLIKIKGE